ncbi:class I SAM-dependent methyltransferase [Halochromatium glycolicum]|uniref:SAM-dependent methyltransferase n=1 Tax=Halochromatium glycolicum TaxID=85075 RepID=A0AAJ0U4J3_9GAMM|nr:methyltransferase domain-containing protein [Halochromatium glycolicum]MBK1705092.1 SAM-dependent methyltransferase [Halochromatium glycolicum]
MRGIEQIPWLYDLSMLLMPGLQRWRRSLARLARGRVLEVGCGTGQMLPLYPDSVELYGLDPNVDALLRAQRRAPGAKLLCATAEHLPFPDQFFDTLVSSLVFCSVADPDRGLAEIRRVLKPQGRLLMLEHVHAQNHIGRWVLDTLQPPWTRLTGGCHPNRDTETRVEGAGFHIEHACYKASGLMRHFVATPELRAPGRASGSLRASARPS